MLHRLSTFALALLTGSFTACSDESSNAVLPASEVGGGPGDTTDSTTTPLAGGGAQPAATVPLGGSSGSAEAPVPNASAPGGAGQVPPSGGGAGGAPNGSSGGSGLDGSGLDGGGGTNSTNTTNSGAASTGGTETTASSTSGEEGSDSGTGGEVTVDETCEVNYGDQVPSLRELYAEHFAIGAAIDTQYNNYTNLLTKHFNSVTAEDQMKFDALQPSEGNFSFGTADQMVDFAVSNGMQVRGHALVWHRQTPSWVFSGSREQVLQRMKSHINNVMKHFQGKVQIWDVVNEAIMDDGSYRTANEEEGQQSGWYGALGESYIAEAFIAAREADPTAKLFYNDYYNYHPVRRQAIYEMLAGLLDDGVPVDGVGIQAHLNLEPGTDPSEQSYHQTVEKLEEAIQMYASLGLDVQVTEMDLSVYLRGVQYTSDMFYTPATFTAEVQEQQAERYREFFEMFRRNSDVISSVSLWGIADDNTWLSEFSSGRQDFPLLFDAQQQPKPAFWAVVDFCD